MILKVHGPLDTIALVHKRSVALGSENAAVSVERVLNQPEKNSDVIAVIRDGRNRPPDSKRSK